MDPKRIVVLGAGPSLGKGIVDVLIDEGLVDIHARDFDGDATVLPRRPPKEHAWEPKRQTGAAAIKRASKKAKRRK